MNNKEIPFCNVKELCGYSKDTLKKELGFTDDSSFTVCVNRLQSSGIIKTYKKGGTGFDLSDLTDEDEVVSYDDTGESLYAFKYVGIVAYGRRVINIFPKYIRQLPDKKRSSHSLIKQIVSVIEKDGYNNPETLRMADVENEGRSFNYLSLSLFLLEDYHENGLYRKDFNRVEVNGEGEILWGKTVNESFTLIQGDRPYYPEIYTRRTVNNSENFFRKLHECILAEISQQFEALGLDDLFGITTIEPVEISLEELEDRDYIKELILKELNIEFNTRKQILLKAMYVYLDTETKHESSEPAVMLFGTNAFNLVWERVCGKVFRNQLDEKVEDLGLSRIPGTADGASLKDMIPYPVWAGIRAGKTLEPDIITIREVNGEKTLFILDAKYYNISINNGKLKNVPGVGDVTKQYLYQLAFNPIIELNGIKSVKNCFLFPTDGEPENMGKATFEIYKEMNTLQDIQMIKLSASEVFEKFLREETIDIDSIGIE